jgi:hypothetical protein
LTKGEAPDRLDVPSLAGFALLSVGCCSVVRLIGLYWEL